MVMIYDITKVRREKGLSGCIMMTFITRIIVIVTNFSGLKLRHLQIKLVAGMVL